MNTLQNPVYTASQERVFVNGDNRRESEGRTIHSTRNYSMFRFSNANRAIDPMHLEQLYDSIERKNLLHLYPISVSANMIVMDGQHRLKAAEALEVPIYYQVDSTITIDDVITLNNISKHWTSRDRLNFWAEKGNDSYAQLRLFLHRHPWFPIHAAIRISTGEESRSEKRGATAGALFRDGLYKGDEMDAVEEVAQFALQLKRYVNWYNQAYLLLALASMFRVAEFDRTRLLTKIDYLSTRLVRCVKPEDYIRMFSEIYNHKVRVENVLDLVKLCRSVRNSGKAKARG